MQDLKLFNNELTMTLKEITDLLEVRHNDAMKTVERLTKKQDFGTATLIKCGYVKGNRGIGFIQTYLLTGTQIDKIKTILDFNRIKAENKSNILYMITDGEYTKIGIATSNAGNRLKQCQTGNPKKLWVEFETLVTNAREIELNIHKLYKDKRLEGEWFNLTEEDKESIKQLLQTTTSKI